jgi:Helix-turn-helix of DDE superfamily endonuclease
VYRFPGMSRRATAALLNMAYESFPDWNSQAGQPKALSLPEALRLCLIRLRRNATYQDLHEDFGISTSTAWSYQGVR